MQANDKTVLVVDDEPDVRQYLASILADAGFNVLTAGDGDEALATIRSVRPDFISLDLVMPKKDGHKVLYELRKDKELSRIPVLIVTAHAQDDLGRHQLEDVLDSRAISGPGAYLEKPVRPADYVRCVKQSLGIGEDGGEVEEKLDLKSELQRAMSGANAGALRRALAALKRKQGGPHDRDQ